ncbi:hypothetical protein BDK63_002492 [Halomonas campaniensis]|uniref:Uncharacterized protein n=1 Tax=Halomonas campaniensis TaxID=213554 RepID=A0A7W5PB76_9GAMM|nr:hypothetical protein [Halomonas campaniensis]
MTLQDGRMITFHSETTKARRARTELDGGRLVAPY